MIRLDGDEVVLTRKGRQQRLSREDIATVCRDGKRRRQYVRSSGRAR